MATTPGPAHGLNMSIATTAAQSNGFSMLTILGLGAVVLMPYLCNKAFEGRSKEGTEVHLLPWWQRGGMHVTQLISVFTIAVPSVLLASPLGKAESYLPLAVYILYGAAWIVSTHSCSRVHGQGNEPGHASPEKALDFYVNFILPLYHMTLLAGVALPSSPRDAVSMLALTLLLFLFKGGVCMSVCLHRFAAHAAFRCGPWMTFALSWFGCMANQGGPIWWASQHRSHHKYCDKDGRDPHSAELVGIVSAFIFFSFRMRLPRSVGTLRFGTTLSTSMPPCQKCAYESNLCC
mmetsp:Transcript_59265/g.135928  ORF Transcript_59265/g.135928 Transcript_59265/m.135928 type:complete len:291 (+) Transcript_59265:142-1014(+)